MKRLRDAEGDSPLLDEARALLDAVEPLPQSEARMQRVRRALDAPEPRGVAVPGLGRVPALAFSIAMVLFGASAFAAVRYVATRSEAPVPAPTAAERAGAKGAAPRRHTEPAKATPAEATEEPAAEASMPALDDAKGAATDERVEAADDAPRPVRRAKPRAARARSAEAKPAETPGAAATPASHDSELVHRAVQALRRDGDPALAARLLDEHARRYPSGPLAEEALSLRVEAATALGDARAASFAREYLQRYPSGRYAGIARAALAKASQ